MSGKVIPFPSKRVNPKGKGNGQPCKVIAFPAKQEAVKSPAEKVYDQKANVSFGCAPGYDEEGRYVPGCADESLPLAKRLRFASKDAWEDFKAEVLDFTNEVMSEYSLPLVPEVVKQVKELSDKYARRLYRIHYKR